MFLQQALVPLEVLAEARASRTSLATAFYSLYSAEPVETVLGRSMPCRDLLYYCIVSLTERHVSGWRR